MVAITLDDKEITHIIGESTALVNGDSIELDVASFTENDQTYLPIRFVMESLGADVQWDEKTEQVRIEY